MICLSGVDWQSEEVGGTVSPSRSDHAEFSKLSEFQEGVGYIGVP